jgi:hypothetical protein
MRDLLSDRADLQGIFLPLLIEVNQLIDNQILDVQVARRKANRNGAASLKVSVSELFGHKGDSRLSAKPFINRPSAW